MPKTQRNWTDTAFDCSMTEQSSVLAVWMWSLRPALLRWVGRFEGLRNNHSLFFLFLV